MFCFRSVSPASLNHGYVQSPTRDQHEQEMSPEGPPEPSLLDYARFYGLARDHLATNPAQLDLPFAREASDGPSLDTEEPDDQIRLPVPAPFEARERLSASRDAAVLLTWVRRPVAEDDFEYPHVQARPGSKRLKLELPVLRTDHDLDMQQHITPILPDLDRLDTALEPPDADADEGLTWPRAAYALSTQLRTHAREERLCVSKDVLLYLQGIVKAPIGGQNRGIEGEELIYERSSNLQSLTPPLMPLSPLYEPFGPSPPARHLDPLSSQGDLTTDELDRVNRDLWMQDAINPGNMSTEAKHEEDKAADAAELRAIYSPFSTYVESSSPSVELPSLACQRKVEGPLTPLFAKPPLQANFTDIMERLPELPPPFIASSATLSSDAYVSTFFDDAIRPIAERVSKTLEQEQLQEADCTKRVAIPSVDFAPPAPPWDMNVKKKPVGTNDATGGLVDHLKLIERVKDEHLQHAPWSGAKQVERELRWIPFPLNWGRQVAVETIEGEYALEGCILNQNLNDEVDTRTMIWKPDGLRILRTVHEDAYDDDCDVDLSTIDGGIDMISSLAKRKRQAYEAETDCSLEIAAIERSPQRMPTSTSFSTVDCLRKFMEARGHDMKRLKYKQSPHFSASRQTNVRSQVPATSTPTEPRAARRRAPAAVEMPLPSPCLSASKPPRSFLVSPQFLQRHRLVRQIERLYPAAEMIERELIRRHELTAACSQAPGRRIRDTAVEEADLTLSPGTGLMCTTIQMIKQRCLPGQGSLSPVKERILNVHTRYEALVVVVSEGRLATSKPASAKASYAGEEGNVSHAAAAALPTMAEADCVAVADLQGFAAALDGDVQVLYVHGGEEELTRWVVALMRQHAADGGDGGRHAPLWHDESKWERFLRHLGLNGYAAQAILSALSTHGQRVGSSDTPSRVAAPVSRFLDMSTDDRVRCFAGLLGGERLLRRLPL